MKKETEPAKPQQIKTLEQLYTARANRRSIVVPKFFVWSGPRPAAVMMNLSGEQLLGMFQSGMFIYEKPAAKSPNWKRASTKYVLAGNHASLARFDKTVFRWSEAILLKRSMESIGYEITIDPPTPPRKYD